METRFDFVSGETLLFDKPLEWTSFDVIRKIRRVIGIKKIGHAGTLDPLATGLLIVCTGKNTKLIQGIQDQEKEYTGSMIMGASTPSYDLETEVSRIYPTLHITPELIEKTLDTFTGNIMQTPPVHSAKKIDGKRAYLIARQGGTAEMKTVPVTIRLFEITDIQMPVLKFRVVCSKGTYIRSLVNDFGLALGSGAHLSSLCRTRIGEYDLAKAWSIPDFIDQVNNKPG